MLLNSDIIIFEQLYPSSLPQIQIFLGEIILQLTMIYEHLTFDITEIVLPDLESKHYRYQLQIMCRIVYLVFNFFKA